MNNVHNNFIYVSYYTCMYTWYAHNGVCEFRNYNLNLLIFYRNYKKILPNNKFRIYLAECESLSCKETWLCIFLFQRCIRPCYSKPSFLPIFHNCCIKILWRRYSRRLRIQTFMVEILQESRGNHHVVGLHPRIIHRLEITFSRLSSLPPLQL